MVRIERNTETARNLTHPIIQRYYLGILDGIFPNALRAMEDCAKEMGEILKRNKFPDSFNPLIATIGDVKAVGFNRKVSTEERNEIINMSYEDADEVNFKMPKNDPFEKEFESVANDLGLYLKNKYGKEDSKFTKIIKYFKKIQMDLWKKGESPHRYETSGRGSDRSKEIFAKQAQSLGLDVDGNDVWLTDGGMGALNRMGISMNSFFEDKFNRRARILAPNPCFTMVPNAQKELGLDISFVDSQDLPAQELTGERLSKYFVEQNELTNKYGGKSDNLPDILYLTPADNPTARSVDPEKLRSVILEAFNKNNEMIFFFDMAYMKLIPDKKASEIMNVIKETGAINHSIFAFSDSKRLGRPASRFGSIVIPKESTLYGKKIGGKDGRMQETTRKINPGFSAEADFMYQAVNEFVSDKDTILYKKLLRQRQQALLEVLIDLDPSGNYFKHLENIYIPIDENEKPPEGSIIQDVPLYLWLEVNKDKGDEFLKKCFDIIEELNIVGVPGTVFKDNNHMRFSLGVVSTLDILKKSPMTMKRWASKLNAN